MQKEEHFASFIFLLKKKIRNSIKEKNNVMQIEQPNDLQGGAIFDSRVSTWIDSIFEKDLASGTVIVHQERLQVPEGLEKYSTPEEVMLRNDVYNINALLNSYRIRQLCTLDRVVSGESLLHAHADLFLSKGYAAWNLNGRSRIDFENSLKRLTDPTLSMLFTGNAPVCSGKDSEIVDSYELKEELDQLKRENSTLQVISEQAADEMADLENRLRKKEEQIKLMEENISDSIQAGLYSKDKELRELRDSIDLIVASALQEQKDTRDSNLYPELIANLKADVKNLKKENTQLEHFLRLAKDALVEKKQDTLLIKEEKELHNTSPRRHRHRAVTEEDDEAFSTDIPMSSITMEDMKTSKKRSRGCTII
jgi:hypothetical protein